MKRTRRTLTLRSLDGKERRSISTKTEEQTIRALQRLEAEGLDEVFVDGAWYRLNNPTARLAAKIRRDA